MHALVCVYVCACVYVRTCASVRVCVDIIYVHAHTAHVHTYVYQHNAHCSHACEISFGRCYCVYA